MRPVRLEFHAFGSFPGRHVVDFDALGRRGLFVVTGPTGAGKTTIFDAMVYALYGRLPGGRAAEGEPRSHHADPDTETYVTLDFEVDGVRHRVRRTPKWERRKQRGSGTTTQQPTAMVGRLMGDDVRAPITQLSQVNAECEQLVGLDFVQFQRVVLLPQGKFNDVLVASDETREVLLRQLFGGDLYERALGVLKQRAVALDAEVDEVDEQVRHHRANAVSAIGAAMAHWPVLGSDVVAPATTTTAAVPPTADADDEWAGTLFDLSDTAPAPVEVPLTAVTTDVDGAMPLDADDLHLADEDRLGRIIDVLELRRDAARAEVDTTRQSAVQAATVAAEIAAAAQRWRDAAGHRATLGQLAATAEAVHAGRATAEASRRARPVVQSAAAEAEARTSVVGSLALLQQVQHGVEGAFEALGRAVPAFDPASVAAAVAQAAAEVEARAGSLHALQRATAAASATEADAAAADAAVQQAAAHLVGLREDEATLTAFIDQWRDLGESRVVRQVEFAAAQQRCGIRTKYDEAVAKAERLTADADRAQLHYLEVFQQYLAAHAPRLAARLTDGEACPVCGSCEHPHPATLEPGMEVIDHDQVDRARGEWTACTANAAAHRATAASLLESLGEAADRSADDLDAERVAAAEALAHAQQAHQQVSTAEQQLAEIRSLVDQALAAQSMLTTAQATARAQADAAMTDRDRLLAETAGIDAAMVAAHQDVLRSLTAVTDGIAARFEAVTAAQATADAARAAVLAALTESGFDDVDTARAALLDLAEERRLDRVADEWSTRQAEATTRLAQLVEQGVPDDEPDAAAARDHADRLAAEADAATARFTTASDSLERAKGAVQQVAAIATASADLRRRQEVARVVYRTCNGDNSLKVKLERWVLGAELDRVTAAANEHLALMTGHRYRLQRQTGAGGGLGLSVIDAHTGRDRATPTLSGGEQFQASLALALGLADVVSHGGTASGRQFEALFVDEGFGSLDPDSLDDAVGALTMLHAAGRMVGVITHVEVMQQRLHVGIEVTPLDGGRGSTLTVHP
ncbi:MAG: AAA family ATPase [Ilumatobacteraceae bacterium]